MRKVKKFVADICEISGKIWEINAEIGEIIGNRKNKQGKMNK